MSTASNAGPMTERVVLVTGAAKRVGAAFVRGFHAQGARVAIHFHRSSDTARALHDELNAQRADSAILVQADLLDSAVIPNIVATTIARFGQLDVLINNASTFYPTPVGAISVDHWDDLIGTNLKAPLFLAQAAAPHLAKTHGLILNMIDIHGQRPLPEHPVYSTAKAGLAMLTRSLARELGPEIRVNGIAPGPILWPEGGIDESLKQEIIAKTQLKRSGSPEDLVKAALFFAIDAPFVTGQILAVDGGRSIGW
jgi:pteridine reductase